MPRRLRGGVGGQAGGGLSVSEAVGVGKFRAFLQGVFRLPANISLTPRSRQRGLLSLDGRRQKAAAAAGRTGVGAASEEPDDPAERPGPVLAARVAALARLLFAEKESPAHRITVASSPDIGHYSMVRQPILTRQP